MTGPGDVDAPAGRQSTAETLAALLKQGLAAHKSGRLGEAAALYRQALEAAPTYPPTSHLLGLVEFQRGHKNEALALIGSAVRAQPQNPDYLADLGMVFHALQRLEDAEGPLVTARRLRRGDPRILTLLASVYIDLKSFEDALDCYREAVARTPFSATLHNNLGNVLQQLGQGEAAADSYHTAIGLDPAYVEARANLANALTSLGRADEAIAQCEEALRLKPDAVGAHFNLAMALRQKGRIAEATESFRAALKLNPRSVEALAGFGGALSDAGRTQEAAEQFELALHYYPDSEVALSSLLFVRNYLARSTPAAMLEDAERFGRIVADRAPSPLPSSNGANPERRLKVGFVSGDLSSHAVSLFLLTTFEAIDRQKLELFAYSTSEYADAVTERLMAAVPNWRRVAGLSTKQIVKMVRADGIDILVDLSGHSANHRLSVFAAKPAPVQVTWLGYFATTGIAAIDYVLANRWVVPFGEETQWVEKVWRMPDTYLCFTPPAIDVEVAPPPALAEGRITFGSFNNLNKLSDTTIEVWSRVLLAVPDSRLLLRSAALADPATAADMRGRFAAQGVDADRVLVEGSLDYAAHLKSYGRVDIALDPFPYAGGTTSIEALWMGVPVLTLAGDRYVSHMGENILHNAGLPQWIAADPGDYVAKAAAFAADLVGLTSLRSGMRARMLASPLLDAPRFARDLENAFRGMWRIWCDERIRTVGEPLP